MNPQSLKGAVMSEDLCIAILLGIVEIYDEEIEAPTKERTQDVYIHS